MGNQEVKTGRLSSVDALRGIAALAVVLFHFTTRFSELFPQSEHLNWGARYGHYGVNLFFIISGFVIFMTLDRCRNGTDFLVSRFSRLYPAYWVSIILTFVVTNYFGLAGKVVTIWQALANLTMVHGFAGVPHVDGVYWTLEVELLFYLWMYVLFALRRLELVFILAGLLILLRISYGLVKLWLGIDLPFIVWRLLILEHFPWFALGLSIYALSGIGENLMRRRSALVLSALAVLALILSSGVSVAVLSIFLAGVVLMAATGMLPVLQWPPLVWLGAISYPLYLLHENIGWSLLLSFGRAGWPPELSVPVVLAGVLLLSHLVSKLVEQPAMHWIRARWKARQSKYA